MSTEKNSITGHPLFTKGIFPGVLLAPLHNLELNYTYMPVIFLDKYPPLIHQITTLDYSN